jgi:PAS domain S-box-containing protein
MKFSSDKAILTGVLLVLVIFTIMVVFSFYQARQANATAELVAHTHEVLAQTSRLQSNCTDNESNARGFLISAREDFLEGIEKSKKDINYSIDTLKKLLADNPEQLKKLEIAGSYANRRVAVSDQIVRVRKEKDLAETIQILTGGKGKLYSDSIRAVLQGMDNDENLLLQNRKEANETAMDFQKRIFLAIVILLLLLVVVLFQNARTDLNERIRLEKELKILNEGLENQVQIKSAQLNNIFERVTDAFMAFDVAGNITYANSRAAEVTKKDQSLLLGKNVFEEFPDAKNPAFYNSFHTAVATGENMRYEFAAPELGIWIEYYLYPSSDGVSCFFRDVTEKKKAEDKLIHSERKYKLLFENNPMPMWMVSLQDYSIIDVNEATLQHYGYSREEFLALDTRKIRPAEDLDKYVEEYQQKFKGVSHRGTWRHKKKDGTIILVEIHAYNFEYEGLPVRLLLVNDITEKQKANVS